MPTGDGLNMLVLFDLPDHIWREMQRLAPGMKMERHRPQDPGYAAAIAEADIVVGWPPVQDLSLAKRLRWLQIASAGANRYVEVLPPDVILTNASGVFGVPIAEHVLAMMLAFTRGIPAAVRAQAEQRWIKGAKLQELFGATCGIVGLGDIGTEIAWRAKAFGMRVLAVKRTVTSDLPPFVDAVWDESGLDELMAAADHVVIALPGTPHTRHMIDARRLSLMKPSAYIYNIGRGSVIDEEALIAALKDKRLAGAGLDVFEQEPLPAASPLWQMENVIITSHQAGSTPHHGARLGEILLRNLPRFLTGEPLENVVDRHWGY